LLDLYFPTDELENKSDLNKQRIDIMNKVKQALQSIRIHGKGYMVYSYLWIWDKNNFLNEVKKYGRNLTLAERDAELELEGSSGIKQLGPGAFPPFAVYKEHLDKFIDLQYQVHNWETYDTFFGFLRLNMSGFKRSVLNQLSQWISLFKVDLINFVRNSLQVKILYFCILFVLILI